MPGTTIYTVGGTVQAERQLYLDRQVDEQLLTLCQAGTFAYVLSPRQLGKSSLMMRTARRLGGEGVRSVVIDLTQLGTQVTAEAWYLGLLAIIEDQLSLDTSAVEWWKTHADLGITQRLTRFFEEVLLKEVNEPIVIFVDEIDTTLSLTFTDDFFTSIRYFYQARIRLEAFGRLTFVLMGVATPGDLIRDPRRTPFNIGQRVDMTDFTLEEALPLAEGLGLPPEEAKQVLGWVLEWTGGHPYLTQRVCRAITEQQGEIQWTQAEVAELITNTFFGEKSEQDNNLQFVRDMLTRRTDQQEEVLTVYREIRASKRAVADEEQSLVKSHLKLSGVVKRESASLRVRNAIYSTVFDEKWVKEHLPVNWAKRLRQAFRLIAVSLLLAVIMGGLAIFALVQQSSANDRASEALAAKGTAESRRQDAEKAQAESARQNQISRAEALSANAVAQLEVDPERSILLAVEAVKLAQQPGLESVLPQANDALRRSLEEAQLLHATLKSSDASIYYAALSPDGRYILSAHSDGTAAVWDLTTDKLAYTLQGSSNAALRQSMFSPDGRSILTTSTDGTASLWDAQTGKLRATLQSFSGLINGVLSVVINGRGAGFSPDSRFVVTAGGDGVGRVWEVATGQLNTELKGHTAPLNDASFSPDGRYILTASNDKTAKLWDSASGQEVTTLSGHTDAILQARFSPDGRYVATASYDRTARLYEVPGGRLVAALASQSGLMLGVTFSPDSRFVVTSNSDYTAKLWQVTDGKELVTYTGHSGRINTATFSPDGRYLATGGTDTYLKIWDTQSGQVVFNTHAHNDAIDAVIFSLDGRQVITVSADGTTKIWESLTGKKLETLTAPTDTFNSAVFSPDGRSILTCSNDNTARVWDVQSHKLLKILQGHTDWVTGAVFSPDGKTIATASRDNTAKIWDAQSGQERLTLKGHLDPLTALNFSQDGRYLVTASRDHTARVWDVQSGQTLAILSGHESDLTSAAFSPDGKTLVTASIDGSARLWDIAETKQGAVLTGHTGPVNSAAFSPDGRYIVTAGRDKTVRLWDSAAGKEVKSFKGHTDTVYQANFSPNGLYLVTASNDGTARLWEVASAKEIATLQGHNGPVTSAMFSPDGNYVLTTGADNTAQLHIVTSAQLFQVAQNRLTRALTTDERVQFGFETPVSTTPTVAASPTTLPTNPLITASPSASPVTPASTLTTGPLPSSGASVNLIEDVKFDTNGKRGGVLNLAGYNVGGNPYYDGLNFQTTLLYATLLGVSDHSKYFPYLLAQAPTLENGGVKVTADGKAMELVLKLKPGLLWSDGSPLTSKDLAFTVKWVNDPDHTPNVDRSIWQSIRQVETPDNQTAILKFDRLYSPYLDFLAQFTPLPEKVWDKILTTNYGAFPSLRGGLPTVTSGPFKVVENIDSTRVVMIRNNYFSPVFGFNAYLDKIVFRPAADSNGTLDTNALLVQINKGELDAALIGKDQLEPLSKLPGSQNVTDPETNDEYLQFNLTNPLFQDKAVRQALNLALDKAALIKLTPYVVAEQSAVMMASLSLFANHSLRPTGYDPVTARQLLERAGWKIGPDGIRVKNGQRLAFSLVTTDRTNRKQVAEAMVAYWKAIGVEATYDLVIGPELFNAWEQNGLLARGNFDVALFAQTPDLDNDYYYDNYHSSQIPSEANHYGTNYGRINDPQIDQAFDLQRNTLDPAKRNAAWQTIQQIVYDNTYEIPVYKGGDYYWVSGRVKNFKPFETIYWNAVEMYVD